MLLLQQMFVLFIIMLAGYICKKKRIITDEGNKVLSSIVVNIANPALILTAGVNKTDTIVGKNLLYAVALAVGVYLFSIIWAVVIPYILKIPKNNAGTYRVMTVFSNIGFMGFPVISAVYGEQALLYASIFLIPYNVLIYTWGIMAMSQNSDKPKSANGVNWGKIFNVGVIACILTIFFYLTRIPVPTPIENVIKHFSNLTAPLSMMVIGALMADMDFKSLFTDVKMIFFLMIKMILIPVVGVLIVKNTGMDAKLVGVCLIMLATPVGSMTAMLAQQYDGDYVLASRGVALSTLLSVVTMPLLSLVLHV